MAYKHRDESPGTYHVTCRGNNKQAIYIDDVDRNVFLRHLTRTARKYGWKIYAYCLMKNHYHLVIEIDERGMSRGFCELNTGYALAFNARHDRINHLFGRRYWSGGLRTEERFLAACRYVLRNPIRAGLVDRPEDWLWSSYRATVGLALAEVPLATAELLGHFGRTPALAVAAFEAFVANTAETRPVRWQPP